MGKEIISLHVGQAGIQMGNAAWEHFCLEHGIEPDGSETPTNPPSQLTENQRREVHDPLFEAHGSIKYNPRALMIDSEPSAVDAVRVGHYRQLVHPNTLISCQQDSGSNYARVFYGPGRALLDKVIRDRIRQLADLCTSFQGFMIYSSACGGAGSGLTALILDHLKEAYPKKATAAFTVFPSGHRASATTVLEPYNSVLATSHCLLADSIDFNIALDNQAMDRVCRHRMGSQEQSATQKGEVGLSDPSHADMNRLVAQVASDVTTRNRYDRMTGLLGELGNLEASHLIPFNRFNFLTCSHVMTSSKKATNYPCVEPLEVREVTQLLFHPRSCFATVDTTSAKFMCVKQFYRGDCRGTDINVAVAALKTSKHFTRPQFVDWAPNSFRTDRDQAPAALNVLRARNGSTSAEFETLPRSATALCNSSAVAQVITRMRSQCSQLHSRRSFLHWLVREGMEEQEVTDCLKEMDLLETDYCEASAEEDDEEEEDEY